MNVEITVYYMPDRNDGKRNSYTAVGSYLPKGASEKISAQGTGTTPVTAMQDLVAKLFGGMFTMEA